MKETKYTTFDIFSEAFHDTRKHGEKMFNLIHLYDLKKIVDEEVSVGHENIPVISSYFVKAENSNICIMGNPYGTVTGTVINGFPVKNVKEDSPSIFELVLDHKTVNQTTVNELKQIIDREAKKDSSDCIVCTLDQYNENGSYWLLERAETVKYTIRDELMFELYFREVL